MPIYEYRCSSCGTVTEVLQKMSDSPLTTCGSCSGSLEKLVSRTSFQLAGGGWYASGYGDRGPARVEGDGKGKESADGDSKSGGDKPSGCGAGCGCH